MSLTTKYGVNGGINNSNVTFFLKRRIFLKFLSIDFTNGEVRWKEWDYSTTLFN